MNSEFVVRCFGLRCGLRIPHHGEAKGWRELKNRSRLRGAQEFRGHAHAWESLPSWGVLTMGSTYLGEESLFKEGYGGVFLSKRESQMNSS